MTEFDPSQTSGTSDHETAKRRKRMTTIAAAQSAAEALSDRDRIAEKAMQAYLLEFGMRDYETIAEWSYKDGRRDARRARPDGRGERLADRVSVAHHRLL